MSEKLPETGGSEEVDLGQLFKLIGNAFERFFKFLGSILGKLFMGFVWLVFFVKKHFLKIGIAGIVGLGLGVIHEKISPPVYSSIISVKQNYNSGKNLYDLVEYYNSFTEKEDRNDLKNILGISDEQTNSILSFDVEPTVSENRNLKSYNDYVNQLDSVLASTIDYDTYINNTKKWDYRHQKVSIKTSQPVNMNVVFETIINKINTTKYFENEQKKDLEQLHNEELAILESLKESEKLKETYKKVLETTTEEQRLGSQTSITIEGKDNVKSTKEYQLHQNDLRLRRELVNIERAKQNKTNIIEIISSEFDSGILDNKIEIFGLKFSRKLLYTLLFPFLTLALLLGLEFMKYLENYKEAV